VRTSSSRRASEVQQLQNEVATLAAAVDVNPDDCEEMAPLLERPGSAAAVAVDAEAAEPPSPSKQRIGRLVAAVRRTVRDHHVPGALVLPQDTMAGKLAAAALRTGAMRVASAIAVTDCEVRRARRVCWD
jgi:hypothetical protein